MVDHLDTTLLYLLTLHLFRRWQKEWAYALSELCCHIYQICYQFHLWDSLAKGSKHFSSNTEMVFRHFYIKQYKQKQSPRGFAIELRTENMHQIYTRTPTSNCDFSKVAYFQNNFYRNTLGDFFCIKMFLGNILLLSLEYFFRNMTTFKFTWLKSHRSKLLPWIFKVISRKNVIVFTYETNIIINLKDVIAPKNKNHL